MRRRKLPPTSDTPSTAIMVYGRGALAKINEASTLHYGLQPTINTLFGQWLEHYVGFATKDQTQSTKINAKAYLKRILPELGGFRLGQINPALLRAFMVSISEEYSPSTQQKMHGLLKRALQDVVNLDVLIKNPMNAVPRPKSRLVNETQPLEPEQLEQLLKQLEGHRLRLVFHLCFSCGLRIGEALALRWDDVRSSILRVNHTINRTYTRSNGEHLFRPAKAGSAREMRLDTVTISYFKQHKLHQQEERTKHGAGFNPFDLVFITSKGTPVDAKNFYNRVFKDLLEQTGLRAQGTHAMRKTYATLAAVKLPIPELQARMGHTDARMTLHYAKNQARRKRAAAIPLQELIDASKIDEAEDE